MRVTIKYSMAVEEGMRRFFFLSSLVSASGNRHVIRSRADSQPGGRSGGAGRGPSPSPARAQPAPLRSRPASPPPPSAPLRAAAALGRCRSPPRSDTTRSARLRSLAAAERGHAAGRAGGVRRRARPARQRNLLGGAARSYRPTPPARLLPSGRGAAGPAAAVPLAPGSGAGGGRSGAPGFARVKGEVPPAAAPIQHRAPRRVPPGYPSRRSGGGWGTARGGTACARTAGVARRRARRLRGMPALIPPCVRGCPSRSFGSTWVREIPRQAEKAGRGIPCFHASSRAPLLPVQRGGRGGFPCATPAPVCAQLRVPRCRRCGHFEPSHV